MTVTYSDCEKVSNIIDTVEGTLKNLGVENRFENVLEESTIEEHTDKEKIVKKLDDVKKVVISEIGRYESIIDTANDALGREREIVEFRSEKLEKLEKKKEKVEGDEAAENIISSKIDIIEEKLQEYQDYKPDDITEDDISNLKTKLEYIATEFKESEEEIESAYSDAYDRLIRLKELIEDILERSEEVPDEDKKKIKKQLSDLELENRQKVVEDCASIMDEIFEELEKEIKDVNLETYRLVSSMMEESDEELELMDLTEPISAECKVDDEDALNRVISLIKNDYLKAKVTR